MYLPVAFERRQTRLRPITVYVAGPKYRLLRLKEPRVCGRLIRPLETALTITMNKNTKRRPVRFGILNLGLGILLATMIVGVAGCDGDKPEAKPVGATPGPAASASPANSPVTAPSGSPVASATKLDALTGRWTGEGGAYLNVIKKGDKFSVEIANLDGPKTFEGTAKGETIEFTRNGKTETIKAASGAETGMKGFEKETNCVVVTKGSEGFCKK